MYFRFAPENPGQSSGGIFFDDAATGDRMATVTTVGVGTTPTALTIDPREGLVQGSQPGNGSLGIMAREDIVGRFVLDQYAPVNKATALAKKAEQYLEMTEDEDPPEQIEMRAAALIAPCPQPDMVRQEQCHPAFVIPRQQ